MRKYYYYDEKNMKMEKVQVIPYILLIFLSIFLLSSSKSESNTIETPQYESEPIFLKVFTGEESFSFSAFKQFILDCNIKFPEIVLAQAIQESKFNSKIWIENNNPFGLKVAKSRNTTAIGVNRGHAKFKNWKMAVLDYAYMQAVYARKVNTTEQYFEYLKQYAEDPGYVAKLKNIIKKHKGFGISKDYMYEL